MVLPVANGAPGYKKIREGSTLVDGDGNAAPGFWKAEHSESAYSAQVAMRHIRARHGAPWAIHCSTFHPHPPWLAAEPFARRYHHSRCGGAARKSSKVEEGAAHPWLAHKLRSSGNAPSSEEELNVLRSQYFACCEEVDSGLGQLFDFLRERDEWKNTMVIFTAE
jgi:arylsulfatase A-like enzyme